MLNRSASLAMSICVLKALPGKLDIKRHSPSFLYILIPDRFMVMFRHNCTTITENRSERQEKRNEIKSSTLYKSTNKCNTVDAELTHPELVQK